LSDLHFTLVSDGPSDRALLPVLRWLLLANGVERAIQNSWADLGFLRNPPTTLADRIRFGLRFYPCDLLFVHRDAEREVPAVRRQEIERATAQIQDGGPLQLPVICVVPVRMMEAWLLFDEAAIRQASGNPRGSQSLVLPRLRQLEDLPDPKSMLHEVVRQASGRTGRRRRSLQVHSAVYRIADMTDDFGPLREVPAFASLEHDLRAAINAHGWNVP
jgi:hypothetical protein